RRPARAPGRRGLAAGCRPTAGRQAPLLGRERVLTRAHRPAGRSAITGRTCGAYLTERRFWALASRRVAISATEAGTALCEHPVAALAVGSGVRAEAVLGDRADDPRTRRFSVLQVRIEVIDVDER